VIRDLFFLTVLVTLASVLLPRTCISRTWHVPSDAPTIQAGIDSAAVGDDVLVSPGEYLEHDLVMKSGIWVHSEQGPSVTTVDANGAGVGFHCTDLQETATIEGFGVVNGHNTEGGGGGVRCVNSNLLVRDCLITDCDASGDGGGIYAWDSNVEIEACRVANCSGNQGGGVYVLSGSPLTVRVADCEILDNEAASGGGIVALGYEVTIVRCVVSGNVASWGPGGGIGCSSPILVIQDCLITGNSETVLGGMSGLAVGPASSGMISGCTVAGNTGWNADDAAVLVYDSDITIDRTVIAFNDGRALHCDYDSQVSVHCCDSYGNTDGDDLCGEDLGGNFSADPLFCDAENGDYTLDGSSPCLPGNHPDGVDCGLIGAFEQGCGAIPVQETTWGRVKSLYRSR
jgi:hypothetical protein